MNADSVSGLPEPDEMRAAAESACALLRVLSNPDRLLLLCELSQGERCVSDLEARLDIRQPTLSQQLGVLRDTRSSKRVAKARTFTTRSTARPRSR